MAGPTYAYDLNTLPETHVLNICKSITAVRGKPATVLIKDLQRTYTLEGYAFDKTYNESVQAAINGFQEGCDENQKELMADTQGLLMPSSLLTLALTDTKDARVVAITDNHISFSKDNTGKITANGTGSVYAVSHMPSSGNKFHFKVVGQPVQELSIAENQTMFDAISTAIKSREKASKPLEIKYIKDGKPQQMELEPLMTINVTAGLNKGYSAPDWKIILTNNDPNIKVNDGLFDQHYNKVKQLDQMVTEATKIQDSVQKWRGRLGSFLGELIGGQKKLDKIISGIEGLLTQDFIGHIDDKDTFLKLYQLPVTEEKKSVLAYADFVLRPPPYPPLIVPTNQPGTNQVDLSAPRVGPAGIARGQEQEQGPSTPKP